MRFLLVPVGALATYIGFLFSRCTAVCTCDVPLFTCLGLYLSIVRRLGTLGGATEYDAVSDYGIDVITSPFTEILTSAWFFLTFHK